jgi:FlaA1/EpsC-like NDP-sugar epimerase
MAARFPTVEVEPCLADIGDAGRMAQLFDSWSPAVVFHAAAHKHVPMMEWNPGEAVKNNVFGTQCLADLAHAHQCQAFVMISTDKAVNPSSIMGLSKRVAEVYVQALARQSATRFVTVRFGNVLGSSGSAIPIFREQIARGGPVTVTHPEMTRYFMTIPEACQLVLQAAAMGAGGEIFVLDMGAPVKIVDLVRDLIRLSGLAPDKDIQIQYTGVRPGEKLFEEIALDDEHAQKTRHPKIFIGKLRSFPLDEIRAVLEAVRPLLHSREPGPLIEQMRKIVPEFRGAPE